MGVANDEDAHANDGDAGPAKQIYFFTEEQEAENGDHEIGKRGGRLDVTVVRPSEHEHVADKKGQQAGDSEPDVAGGENLDQNVKELPRLPIARGADRLHSLAEQHIAEGGEEDDEEKKNAGFQMQTWRMFHAICDFLPREVLVLLLKP